MMIKREEEAAGPPDRMHTEGPDEYTGVMRKRTNG